MDEFNTRITTITSSLLEFSVKVDEDATIHYILLPYGTDLISLDKDIIKEGNIVNGTNVIKSGNATLRANEISKITFNGLSVNTSYLLAVFIEDEVKNSTNPHVFITPTTSSTPSTENTVTVSSDVIIDDSDPLLEKVLPAYIIDNDTGTISRGELPIRSMMVKTFLSFIVKNNPEQTVKVFSKDESTGTSNTPKTDDAQVQNGDVLEVTSKNGQVKRYSIVVGEDER